MDELTTRQVMDQFGPIECGMMQSRVDKALNEALAMSVTDAHDHIKNFADRCYEYTIIRGHVPPDNIPFADVERAIAMMDNLKLALARAIPLRHLFATTSRQPTPEDYSRDRLREWLPPGHWEEVERCCTANGTMQCQSLATAIIIALIENAIEFAEEFEGEIDVKQLQFALSKERKFLRAA